MNINHKYGVCSSPQLTVVPKKLFCSINQLSVSSQPAKSICEKVTLECFFRNESIHKYFSKNLTLRKEPLFRKGLVDC